MDQLNRAWARLVLFSVLTKRSHSGPRRVEFIDENGGGPGVRLRKPGHQTSSK
jgi:hypothetical protein